MKEDSIVRLQKYLADKGVASRRKCEEFIMQGRVKVNGQIVTELGTKINASKDVVEFDNNKILNKEKNNIYILLNKPIGYVTTVKDQFRKRYSIRFNKRCKTKSCASWQVRYVYIWSFNFK